MCYNIPICITFLRLILIPIFVITFYLPFYFKPFITSLIFFIAAATDWLDGFVARRWKQTTNFGKLLDPIADKIIVTVSVFLISEYFHVWFITIPSFLIIIREIIVAGLRQWIAEVDKCKNITVSKISKIKTSIQMLSLFILLWHPCSIFIHIGILLLYIALIITIYSMIKYICKIQFDIFK
ncbi:MAG: CDP-diacylglycerol--glycerol-3-phosphate 3-phosphatidyltransferase [Pantoea sp. Brub]|nr:CDP-diacylglycerol--glycerol-3-phosphate 3-phosphatidyltransferase [Pantoea sp. Brub]